MEFLFQFYGIHYSCFRNYSIMENTILHVFFVIFFVFIKLYFTYFYKPKHDQIGSKYVEILYKKK
jgi:hypothetical protein